MTDTNRGVSDSPTPSVVRTAVKLIFLSLAVGVAGIIVDNDYAITKGELAFFVPFLAFFAWKIGAGRNWARMFFIGLTLLILLRVSFMTGDFDRHPLSVILALIQAGLLLGATVLLFTGAARYWFKAGLMKLRNSIIFIVVGLVLGVGGCGSMILGIGHSRATPERTNREVTVLPMGEAIVEIEATDARYEFDLRSESSFDFVLLAEEKEISRYKAKEKFSVGDEATNVRNWQTFIQTGSGNRFALVFVNHGKEEIVVRIDQALMHNPSDIGTTIAMFSIFLSPVFGLVGIVHLVRALLKRRWDMAAQRSDVRAPDQ